MSTAIVAMKDAFEWDRASQGMVLSAFFYGYAVTQIVGGETADARGGRAVLAFGVGAWSAATALTPMAAHAGVGPLVVTRIALGMSEGLAFPAAHAVIASEVPRERRSTAAAAVTAASYAGAAFAFAVTPGLIREFGWEGAFYAFGALGVLWIPFWLALSEDVGRGVTTTPTTRRDDENEDDGNESETARLTGPVASTSDWHRSFAVWQALMRRREVRAICVAQFTQSWGMYGLLSWLPTYFTEAHGVDLGDASHGLAWHGNMHYAPHGPHGSVHEQAGSIFLINLRRAVLGHPTVLIHELTHHFHLATGPERLPMVTAAYARAKPLHEQLARRRRVLWAAKERLLLVAVARERVGARLQQRLDALGGSRLRGEVQRCERAGERVARLAH